MTDKIDITTATASEMADLLEYGGVPLDSMPTLFRRNIALLREYASLSANASLELADRDKRAPMSLTDDGYPE